MPELPEVETIARALRPRVSGARVRSARVAEHPDWVDARAARGSTIVAVRRIGKHLLLDLDDAWTLDVHLGMTGNVRLHEGWSAREQPERHERMRLHLVDGATHRTLQLVDPRGFGHVHLGEREADGSVALPSLQRMGPDAWDAWTLADLRSAAARRGSPIKAMLLDQHVVAGIGNYVVDESLHRARVHPAAPARALSAVALRRIHEAVVEVLGLAIDAQGATLRDYRGADGERGGMQHLLMVYGRAGEPCLRCGTPLEKSVVGGRGTTHCPRCQRLRG